MSSGTQPDSPQVIRSFDPDRDGMCGNQAPAVLIGIAPPVCGLRWGHRGWHEAEDGSKWSREDADLPSSVVASGQTPAPEGDGAPGTLLGDLRAEIADTVNAELTGICASWRPSFADRAADALVKAGFVRVSVDDDTVERVARMVHDHDCDAAEDGPCQQYELHRKWHIATARFAVLAAVQALRDGSGT